MTEGFALFAVCTLFTYVRYLSQQAGRSYDTDGKFLGSRVASNTSTYALRIHDHHAQILRVSSKSTSAHAANLALVSSKTCGKTAIHDKLHFTCPTSERRLQYPRPLRITTTVAKWKRR